MPPSALMSCHFKLTIAPPDSSLALATIFPQFGGSGALVLTV
jgi:hypothetical protein